MGGELWQEEMLKWVVGAIKAFDDFEMYLYWNNEIITKILDKYNLDTNLLNRIEIVDSEDDIKMDTKDINAVRKKVKASMSRLISDLVLINWFDEFGSVIDWWITAWNTWVWIMWAKREIKSLNVEWIRFWQAMAAFIPKTNWWKTLMLDFWASVMWNTEQKVVKTYLNNTLMAIAYLKASWIKNPTIWLMNIWEEESKWSKELQVVYKKLKEMLWENFIWNVEWNNLLTTKADILITDATTWNHMLKVAEWLVKNIFTDFMKKANGDKNLEKIIFEVFEKYNSKETWAALCLWLKNNFYITHWNSDSELIKHAILRAREDIINWTRIKLVEELQNLIKWLPSKLKKEVWNK